MILSPHLIECSQFMLLFIENFIKAVHRQESNPGYSKFRNDFVCHRSLPAGRPPTHSNHKRLNLLSLAVVPGWSSCCVDGSLWYPDNWFSFCADGGTSADSSLPLSSGQRTLRGEGELIQTQGSSQAHGWVRTAGLTRMKKMGKIERSHTWCGRSGHQTGFTQVIFLAKQGVRTGFRLTARVSLE